MGAGGVGGYYGGKLALGGNDVTLIARGEHLQAIRAARGLVLRGPDGAEATARVQATDDASGIAAVDVILFCVKLFDTETAARAIAPLHAKGGICVSLQNGVDGQHRIGAVLGPERVLGGLAFVSALVEAPGVVRYNSKSATIQFGEADGSQSARATAFRDACLAAGIGAEVAADIHAAQWNKFVGLVVNAGLTALVRQPVGVVYNDPDIVPLARTLFQEGADVARALGISMPADIVERQLANHRGFPPQMYASMYHDLARGKRLELDSLSGLIVRKGRELGVPTPAHAMVYACLKPYINGARPS
jgi:2-dehydropantoate 2-reductase